MRNFLRELDSHVSGWLSPVVKWQFYLCVLVYLVYLLGSPFGFSGYLFPYLGASPAHTIYRFQLWQLFTYAFVHVSFIHLFFNLMALYFFGHRLEQRWGSRQYFRFSLVVGIGAVLIHLAVALIRSQISDSGAGLHDTIVGISGLVYGVMMACAYYYPNDVIYFQFILPIKLKYVVAILGFITLISTPIAAGGGVAHLTHLGGLLFGYLFVRFPGVFDKIPLPRLPGRRRKPQVRQGNRWRDL